MKFIENNEKLRRSGVPRVIVRWKNEARATWGRKLEIGQWIVLLQNLLRCALERLGWFMVVGRQTDEFTEVVWWRA
jgi:hypothetical protein